MSDRKYYAHYETRTGRMIGIYDTDAYAYIPSPNVEITREENDRAQEWLQKGYEIYVVNGHLEWRSIFVNDFATAKKSKLQEINLKADYVLYYLIKDYPTSELASWYKQELEAKLYKLDPVNHPSLLIENIAAARGMDVNDLVDKVLLKAAIFSKISGMVFGRRQKYEDQLSATFDITDVDKILVDFSDIVDIVTSKKDVILS